MTTLHKAVLSLIAAICISLILFYSIKGNSHRPQPVAVVLPSAQPTAPAPTAPDEAARAAAMQQPVHVGPSDQPRAQGLDELVAKVRSEITSNEPTIDAAIPETTSTPILASANAPTAVTREGTSPAAADDVADFVLPDSTDTGDTDALDGPRETGDTTPPSPQSTVTAPASANADAAASVPTFTLGEPPRKERIADDTDATVPSVQGGARSRDFIEGPVDELTDLTGPRETLPPLVRIRSNDEPPQPAPQEEAKAADSQTPPVIVIDPHQPAIKAVEPTAASPSAAPQASANAATRSPAVSDDKISPPATTVPAAATPAASASALRTYTVKPGDSFSAIASRELGAERHWLALVDANPGVDPKRIKVGQVINLPDMDGDEPRPASPPATTDSGRPAPAAKPVAAPSADAGDVKFHEVAPGENLSSISRKHFNTPDHWRHIYLTNRDLIGGDPGKLHAGLKLKITAPKAD